MLNQLLDVSIKTMIGMLPDIINSNNEYITDAFDNIYDSSSNRLIKSLYNPNGNVIVHSGEFQNVVTDNLIINDISTFNNNTLKKVDHNVFANRLYNIVDDTISPVNSNDVSLYSHNTGSIVHIGINGSECLANVIETLQSQIKTLESYYGNASNNAQPAVYGLSSIVENTVSNPNSYTLDKNVLFANKSQLMKLKLRQWQYLDIADGILYTYYDYNPVITITDEHPASINGIEGSIVNIKFEDKKKSGFYKIMLSRIDNKVLRIGKDDLIRLKLVCVEHDPVYGTIWDVDSYSVRKPEDISIIKK